MSNIKNKFNVKQNKSRAKKGISPVIATVILVAVAVVIAAAMAGFSSSLFATYSENSQVKLVDASLTSAGAATLVFSNAGASGDSVTSVQVPPAAAVVPSSGAIAANSASSTVSVTGLGTFAAGQQVTMVINLNSGAQITQSVSVQ